MPPIASFHSVNEADKPSAHRVYHNKRACPSGRAIPIKDRRPGTGRYRQCDHCKGLKG